MYKEEEWVEQYREIINDLDDRVAYVINYHRKVPNGDALGEVFCVFQDKICSCVKIFHAVTDKVEKFNVVERSLN